MKVISKKIVEGYFNNSHRYFLQLGQSFKKEISLVYPCYYTLDTFEIYCIEGDLFDGVERYNTLREAENRIKELLK